MGYLVTLAVDDFHAFDETLHLLFHVFHISFHLADCVGGADELGVIVIHQILHLTIQVRYLCIHPKAIHMVSNPYIHIKTMCTLGNNKHTRRGDKKDRKIDNKFREQRTTNSCIVPPSP